MMLVGHLLMRYAHLFEFDLRGGDLDLLLLDECAQRVGRGHLVGVAPLQVCDLLLEQVRVTLSGREHLLGGVLRSLGVGALALRLTELPREVFRSRILQSRRRRRSGLHRLLVCATCLGEAIGVDVRLGLSCGEFAARRLDPVVGLLEQRLARFRSSFHRRILSV